VVRYTRLIIGSIGAMTRDVGLAVVIGYVGAVAREVMLAMVVRCVRTMTGEVRVRVMVIGCVGSMPRRGLVGLVTAIKGCVGAVTGHRGRHLIVRGIRSLTGDMTVWRWSWRRRGVCPSKILRVVRLMVMVVEGWGWRYGPVWVSADGWRHR